MTLVTLSNLSKHFGSLDLFSGINLSIVSERRYALVGANGAGKSTLARIIAGDEESSDGSVQSSAGIRVSYVPQHPDFPPEENLIDVLGSPWAHLKSTLRESEDRLASAGNDTSMSAALKTYQRARDDWDAIGGDEIEQRAEAALETLGVPGPYDRPVSSLSGGEAGLLALAGALAVQPDLLILD